MSLPPLQARLPDDVRKDLADTCRRRLPAETCGVLFGQTDGRTTVIDGFAVVRNAAPDTARAFSFDPADWTATYYDAQKNRRQIAGFFHSHPHGSPLPSAEDASGWLAWGTYWIVAWDSDGGCDIAAYCRDESRGWVPLSLN